MAVTYSQPIQIATGSWLCSWSSDQSNPDYRIWYGGKVVAIQTEAYIVVESTNAPAIEVDDGDSSITISQEQYPGVPVIQWFGDPNADYYLVEENDGGWTELGRVFEDKLGYYEFRPDQTSADIDERSFRVTPYDQQGNAGTAVSFDVLVVRAPDPPAPTLVYDSGSGDLQVSH